MGDDEYVINPVKIRFELHQDDGGWPPAETEGVWAVPIGGDLFRVDNTPWFVRGVAADDVVQAIPDPGGVLWFRQVHQRSGHVVVRVIPRSDGRLAGDRQAVLDAFTVFGVSGEGMSAP